jgi:hypothetical protein
MGSWPGHFEEQKDLLPLPGYILQIIQPTAQSLRAISYFLYFFHQSHGV